MPPTMLPGQGAGSVVIWRLVNGEIAVGKRFNKTR
jgi:hypothetical protein